MISAIADRQSVTRCHSRLLPAFLMIVAGVLAPNSARGQATPMVQFTTEFTDLMDNPVSSVLVGEEYKVRVIVQDIRQDPPGLGVFSAVTTLTFDDALSSLVLPQTVQFGSHFDFLRSSSFGSDSVSAYAASTSPTPPGIAPQYFFSVRLVATAAGLQTFLPTFYEPSSEDGTFLYGVNPPLPLEENILYFGSPLQILVPEPSTWVSMAAALAALATVGLRRRRRA